MYSFLRELYYGNLRASVRYVREDPEYRELTSKIIAEVDRWKAKLSEEDMRQFSQLQNLQGERDAIEVREGFCSGFSLGALLICEALSMQESLIE